MYSINKKQESCCMRVIENAVKKTEKVFAFSVFLCVVFARCVFIDRGRFLESFWLSLFFPLTAVFACLFTVLCKLHYYFL